MSESEYEEQMGFLWKEPESYEEWVGNVAEVWMKEL